MGGTAIGENAVVQDSIMGPGAVVGASAHVVGHSVLGTGAVLVDGEYLTGQCRLEVA
jgi:carbonic anhydrase/acetyltransferase-like protein (isoleucine patch superfamily)